LIQGNVVQAMFWAERSETRNQSPSTFLLLPHHQATKNNVEKEKNHKLFDDRYTYDDNILHELQITVLNKN